jgi:hypothetical protein
VEGYGYRTMKEYLGDAVYVETDGDQIVLTTENGTNRATNLIVLETDTWQALKSFIKRTMEL